VTTLERVPGVRIGPEGVPPDDRTLGWAVLGWTARWLLHPDGPNARQPWKYTPEQARMLLWWYAIDDSGRFVYRRGLIRRMKGWGKDPFGATLCATEFVGPCRFGGWGPDGRPIAVGHPAAWVQVAAVAKDQTRNTMTLFPGLFSKEAQAEFEIDMGKEIIYARHGEARIEAVTSSPRALEGGRPTFILKNETQHWLKGNEGHAMSAVIARNAAKGRDGATRSLSICNAFNPGEDSDAEQDHNAWEKMSTGRSQATGFWYDALEAPPDVELAPRATGEDGRVTDEDLARARESLRLGLLAARGDSDWVDTDRLIEEIYDPTTSPSTSRRWYLNQIIATEDAWVSPQEWDRLAAPGEKVAPGELITLGFDGSKNEDNTALVGCRVSDSYLWAIEIWDPEKFAEGEVPRAEVDAAVARTFAEYDVVGFFSDVHPFETYIDKWEEDYGDRLCVRVLDRYPIGWDMRGRKAETTRAVESFHSAIVEGDLRHDGNKLMAQHVYNARRMPNNYGVTFRKESPFSPKKVDAAAAAMLAREGRQQYIALPENKKRKVSGPSVYESRGVRRL
jgi:hypothetical protein